MNSLLNNKPAVKRKKGYASSYIVLFCVVIATFVSIHSAIIIFFGMMPSLLNIMYMRGKGYQPKSIILIMNAAGVFPYWVEVIFHQEPLKYVLGISKDPFVWLIMWGSVVLGIFIMWSLSVLAESAVDVFVNRRIITLTKNQENLIEEFGEGIKEDALKKVVDL